MNEVSFIQNIAGVVVVLLLAVTAILVSKNRALKRQLTVKYLEVTGLRSELRRAYNKNYTELISTTCRCGAWEGVKGCGTKVTMTQDFFHRYDLPGYFVVATNCPNFPQIIKGEDITMARMGDGWIVLETHLPC
ncbi:MAG: hypothetical protein UU77_C0018G0004 [candidate division WWE3 bacterium GW2011_GWC1_41_7]|uniref:Uncharacterized protein n=1 Tax=candidate division WWE3 bacterium GW2011_GWC1_41_7 TaxID=1619119 RepID=A0A0G0X6P8_UNCKA|nr:MAG: hypothetical protein UU77_C0018G0004 [candidate division WWE3 bacterium GW2011_GWC1_41_7]